MGCLFKTCRPAPLTALLTLAAAAESLAVSPLVYSPY